VLVRPALAVLVLCLLLAGCGDDGNRDAVASYIGRANTTQQRLSQPLLDVTKANRAFASRKSKQSPAAIHRRLVRSERKIRALREELAAVTAPPEARRLRTLLLALIDREADLTREVAQLVAFIPAFGRTLQPLAPAGSALKVALAGKGSAAAKADALDAYGAVGASVIVRLQRLRPPPSSQPVFRSQIRTLRRVGAAVGGLADALRAARGADVRRFLTEFNRAAVSNQSTAAQSAQIAAVKAYNARVRSLTGLLGEIARERGRLEQQLR
jgi:hypothetical protein